jgi:hypothetical protein
LRLGLIETGTSPVGGGRTSTGRSSPPPQARWSPVDAGDIDHGLVEKALIASSP